MTVDHIDFNSGGLDNRRGTKGNLRIVNKAIQATNTGLSKRNKHGIKGISYDKRDKRYIAYWVEKNKERSKSFAIRKYGNNKKKAMKKAYRYRLKKISQLENYNAVTLKLNEIDSMKLPKHKKNMTLIEKGVSYNERRNCYVVRHTDNNHKSIRTTFTCKNTQKEKALEEARLFRKEKETEMRNNVISRKRKLDDVDLNIRNNKKNKLHL